MSVLFFLTALVACAFAAQQIQCNFELRSPTMPSGYVRGTLKYDFTNKKLLHSYTTTGTQELYSFNTEGGFTNTKDQYKYTWATDCGCKIASVPAGIPVLFSSTQYLNPSTADGKTPNTPKTSSLLKTVILNAQDYPVKSTWTDGRVFTYSGCTALPTGNWFVPPKDCKCGKPIDVVLVLDRSSSINYEEADLEKKFTINLVNSFEYSALGVNLGITHFHTTTWDGPVTLATGNNAASVKAGASAIQCAPDAQCHVYGASVPDGSCCGSGTSISSGIVNGADMLASVPQTGFRKDAAKVLIVLTDGYHNKILKMSGGTISRDGNGKPQGVPYVVAGKTCTENASQKECVAGLLSDIDYAVQYAVTKVPSVNIISVGVGDTWSYEQLLHIANNKDSNVLGTQNWGELSSLVDDLVAVTCQQTENVAGCTGCCGFCSCGGCVPVDGCDTGNFCDNINLQGTCCTTVAKPPTVCDDTSDKCRTYFCDRNANDGLGGCNSSEKPIKADTECEDYKCIPATGEVTFEDKCPPLCLKDEECDDKKYCTIDKCVIDPVNPRNNHCEVTPRNCDNVNDKCQTWKCDEEQDKCVGTVNPVPANTTCDKYECVPATGEIKYTDDCPEQPQCSETLLCNDNNACTTDECGVDGRCTFKAKPDTNCIEANKCFTYKCDPAIGCTKTALPVPESTTCSKYTCDPETGETLFEDLCPPPPACVVDEDCDDKNFCTVDECVLENPEDPKTAKCVWNTMTAEACDDSNACTTDYCDPVFEGGCRHDPLPETFCDDNDACTIDICDPLSTNVTFPCRYEEVVCNGTDVCHTAQCDAAAGCLILDIVCPTTDNCTISGCNSTDGEHGGCYVEDAGTCGFPAAAVAGITAGVIAGIVIAAIAGALCLGGGAAYAFTQGAGSGIGATVVHNPIFERGGEHGYNALHKH